MATATTLATNQRRESRYGVTPGESLPVGVLIRLPDDTEQNHNGEILDLSRSGAKVQLDWAPPDGAQLTLTLQNDLLDIDARVSGTVCWRRPAEGDRWWIGCSFDDTLPFRILAQLAVSGIIDRRSDPREPYEVAVRCRRQLNNEDLDAILVNVSRGGFAIRLERSAKIEVDERLLIQIGDSDGHTSDVIGKVCWHGEPHEPVSDTQQIGCSFVSREGYPTLRQRLGALKFSQQRRRKRLPVRTLLGLLLGVATAALGATILLRGRPW